MSDSWYKSLTGNLEIREDANGLFYVCYEFIGERTQSPLWGELPEPYMSLSYARTQADEIKRKLTEVKNRRVTVRTYTV